MTGQVGDQGAGGTGQLADPPGIEQAQRNRVYLVTAVLPTPLVQALNTALAEMAGHHGAVVADVHGRFLGHGTAAGDPSQVLARPANRDLWYCGLIEPNAWGAHEIRRTWWQALGSYG